MPRPSFVPQPSFYRAVVEYLFGRTVVPTPQQFAVWLGSQEFADPPAELDVWIRRLLAWPHGHPYPPIPDDQAIAHGIDPPDPRWWTPGAKAGSYRPIVREHLRNLT